MSPTPISQDVVNHIIDFLHEDKESLSATSVVSKGWVHVSRCHLFHRIRVVRPRETFPFDFLTFLQSNPHIAIHIKQLYLEGNIDDDAFPQLLDALPDLSALSISDSSSPLRLVTCPVERRYKVDYLCLNMTGGNERLIRHCPPSPPPLPPMPIPPLPYGRMGELDFDRIIAQSVGFQVQLRQIHADNPPNSNADYQDIGNGPSETTRLSREKAYNEAVRMHNFLSVFSSIHKLDVSAFERWDLISSQLVEIVPDTLVGRLAVTSFRALYSTSQSFIGYFNRILDLSTLEELLLGPNSYPACQSLRTLMESSPNLTYIGFGFERNVGGEGDRSPSIGLQKCLSLRSLFIQPDTTRPLYVVPPIYDWPSIRAILNDDVSGLRHLYIQIFSWALRPGQVYETLVSIDWEWLEEKILEGMPDLMSVEFLFDVSQETTDAHETTKQDLDNFIFERLPRARRKGLVKIGKSYNMFDPWGTFENYRVISEREAR